MQFLNFFTLFALFYTVANCDVLDNEAEIGATGQANNHVHEKRFTMPDLAPKSTVELKTTGTATSLTTTPALYGHTTVTLSTGTAVPTDGTGSSSKGLASTHAPIPLAGLLLLALAGF